MELMERLLTPGPVTPTFVAAVGLFLLVAALIVAWLGRRC